MFTLVAHTFMIHIHDTFVNLITNCRALAKGLQRLPSVLKNQVICANLTSDHILCVKVGNDFTQFR